MPLREAIAAKAGPTVLTAISRYQNAINAELKRVILECFSNVGTRLEANHYLRNMRLNENNTLMIHNVEYAAAHAVAYGMTPEEQTDQQVLQSYVNTLGNTIADKLNRKIFRKKHKSHIRTLKDTMEEAESLEQCSRQEEISRLERNSTRNTTIVESVNMISDTSVNFPHSPRGDRFNSTMKQTYSPNHSQNSYNNGYNYPNSYDNLSPYQNTFNSRRLQRYRHQPQWPKRNIKFEYNARDKNMFGNIRRTVDYIKDNAHYSDAAKKLPKFTNRAQEEVNEDSIATISIEEIQSILHEDMDLIFDALVIADYIKEETDA